MNTLYKVSICVPIYGVEKYIERCTVCLFEQSYENIEYIFVNDCTPDRSIEILKSVMERYPRRKDMVKIISHNKNKGLGAARNAAVEAVTGEFLMHVDSDDWLDNDCVRLCVEKQIKTNADIVSMDILRVRSEGQVTNHIPDFSTVQDFILAMIKHTIPNNVWGRLIRTSLYKENDIKVEGGVNLSEDLNVMPRLAYYASSIATVVKPLYFYECRNQSSYTSNFSEKDYLQIETTCDVLANFFNGKGDDYINAIEERLYVSLVSNMINSSRGKGNRVAYGKIRTEIDARPRSMRNMLPLPYKLAVSIHNYDCFRIYIRLVSTIKRLIK